MTDSLAKEINEIEEQETIDIGEWFKPFKHPETYEKIKPVMSREFKMPTGEQISVYLRDPEEDEKVTITPRRKALAVVIKDDQDDYIYTVEARLPQFPDSNRVGYQEPSANALGFELWETESLGSGIDDDIGPEPGDEVKPSPFLCNLTTEVESLELRFEKIKK